MSAVIIKTADYEGPNRRGMNGDGKKLVWTIMVASCGVVFIGFMAWMTAMQSSIGRLSDTSSLRAERLAALESNVGAINGRLLNIEAKLDKVLELRR